MTTEGYTSNGRRLLAEVDNLESNALSNLTDQERTEWALARILDDIPEDDDLYEEAQTVINMMRDEPSSLIYDKLRRFEELDGFEVVGDYMILKHLVICDDNDAVYRLKRFQVDFPDTYGPDSDYDDQEDILQSISKSNNDDDDSDSDKEVDIGYVLQTLIDFIEDDSIKELEEGEIFFLTRAIYSQDPEYIGPYLLCLRYICTMVGWSDEEIDSHVETSRGYFTRKDKVNNDNIVSNLIDQLANELGDIDTEDLKALIIEEMANGSDYESDEDNDVGSSK